MCNFPDCSKPTVAKGYCHTHYRRLLRNGKIEPKIILNTVECVDCGTRVTNTWRKGRCDKCYDKYLYHIQKDDIIYRNAEWKQFNDVELKRYAEKVFRHFRKHGFPYKEYEAEKIHAAFDKLIGYEIEITDSIIPYTSHLIGEVWGYFPHVYEIKSDNKYSPIDIFNNDDLFRRAIGKRLKMGTYMDNNGMRKGLKLAAGGIISNFRPSAAKAIYDTYLEGDTVYDFSGGFGGRLFGALASNKVKTYIAVEPSFKTFVGLNKIKDDFINWGKNVQIINMGSEDYQPEITVDLCFSSPPYFDVEKYSAEETQSYIKYPNYSDWLNVFVGKTVQNCYNALRPGGKFIVNIAPTKKIKTLDKDYCQKCIEAGFILEDTIKLQMMQRPGNRQNGVFRYEPIYIFRKP